MSKLVFAETSWSSRSLHTHTMLSELDVNIIVCEAFDEDGEVDCRVCLVVVVSVAALDGRQRSTAIRGCSVLCSGMLTSAGWTSWC
jgi:hypothetical protein